MNDLDRLQASVGAWAGRTFPTATNATIAAHLADECAELALAAHTDDDGIGTVAEEAADCLLLLLHLAHRTGVSLFDAAVAKAAVNERRSWQTEPNGRGYFGHEEPATGVLS